MAAAAARSPVLVWSDAMWEGAPRLTAASASSSGSRLTTQCPPALAAASFTAGGGPRSPTS
eukprot:5172935-Prymnesium_polylepis.1